MSEKEFLIGEKIRTLRISANETQTTLAKMLNQQRSTIACYETNKRMPTFDVIAKIAEHYGVSLDYFTDLTKDNVYTSYMIKDKLSSATLNDTFVYEIVERFFNDENISNIDKEALYTHIINLYKYL